jgi:hypothetical protein
VFHDGPTRELLVDQAARTFYFRPAEKDVVALPYVGSLALLFHGMQLLWAAAIAFASANRRRLSFKGMGLLSAPALYLLPFLFTIVTSITHGTSSRATSPWPSVRCSSSAGTLAIVAPG